MKYLFTLTLLLFISSLQFVAAKSPKNIYIESASQFQRWCKKQSYRHFRKKKQQAYNWSASTIRELNDYKTKGSWKVNNVKRLILCQIRIGKKAKHTKIEIF